jgi:prepilin-type N-terminal cleavage/methylation domain-containing protein
MNRSRFSIKNTGFTLIEVLVAIAIVGFVVIMHDLVVRSLVASQFSRNKELALTVASHKLEELRGLGYSSLPVSGSFADTTLSALPSGTASITVSNYNAGVKHVTVTVSWTEQTAGARSVVLDTLIAQAGVVN